MKFVMSSYGTRGEVEPCVAVGRELVRRGHEVCMAVPRDLVSFVESAGLEAVAYELDAQAVIRPYVDLWRYFYFSRNLWKIREASKLRREQGENGLPCFWETSRTLMSLADGADLILTGHEYRAARRQRRRVLRHSVGHGALLPDAGQRPDHSDLPAAVAPPRTDNVRVADVADDEGPRGRTAP